MPVRVFSDRLFLALLEFGYGVKSLYIAGFGGLVLTWIVCLTVRVRDAIRSSAHAGRYGLMPGLCGYVQAASN